MRGPSGTDHFDTVGSVASSSLPRLTAVQRYRFDSIFSNFGKDMGQCLYAPDIFRWPKASGPKCFRSSTNALQKLL